MSECGCLIIPEAVAVLDPRDAECSKHGWTRLVRKATMREWVTMELGVTYNPEPDEPPF